MLPADYLCFYLLPLFQMYRNWTKILNEAAEDAQVKLVAITGMRYSDDLMSALSVLLATETGQIYIVGVPIKLNFIEIVLYASERND